MFNVPTHYVEIPLCKEEFRGLFVPIREIKDDCSVYWLYAPANVCETGTTVISRYHNVMIYMCVIICFNVPLIGLKTSSPENELKLSNQGDSYLTHLYQPNISTESGIKEVK